MRRNVGGRECHPAGCNAWGLAAHLENRVNKDKNVPSTSHGYGQLYVTQKLRPLGK